VSHLPEIKLLAAAYATDDLRVKFALFVRFPRHLEPSTSVVSIETHRKFDRAEILEMSGEDCAR
jgi:hypothetical protein